MLRLSQVLMSLNAYLGGLPLEVLRAVVEHFRRTNDLPEALAVGLPVASTVRTQLLKHLQDDIELRRTDAHVRGAIEKYMPVLFEPLPEVPPPEPTEHKIAPLPGAPPPAVPAVVDVREGPPTEG